MALTQKEKEKLAKLFRLLSRHPDFLDMLSSWVGEAKLRTFLKLGVKKVVADLQARKTALDTAYKPRIDREKAEIDKEIAGWNS